MSKLPFKSDGCTGVPDFNLRHCCIQHDRDYHDGELTRAKADFLFFQCISSKGIGKGFLARVRYNFIGLYYWAGVRVLGRKYYKGAK